MFEVGVVSGFRATHRLVGDFGAATREHGHEYRVQVAVRGPSVAHDGTLCDIGWLRDVVADVLATLDGRDLNDVEPLAGANPTAEAVAAYLFRALAPRTDDPNLRTLSVEVWETPEAYARYDGALPYPAADPAPVRAASHTADPAAGRITDRGPS